LISAKRFNEIVEKVKLMISSRIYYGPVSENLDTVYSAVTGNSIDAVQ